LNAAHGHATYLDSHAGTQIEITVRISHLLLHSGKEPPYEIFNVVQNVSYGWCSWDPWQH